MRCIAVLGLLTCFVGAASSQSPAPTQPQTNSGLASPEAPAPNKKRRGPEDIRAFLGLGAPPDKAAADKGAPLFQSNCAFCHGAKASGGDTGPDLVRSSLVLHDEKGETIGPVVHNGRTARGMPAFPNFSNDELYHIAEFLHLRVELTANRGEYKLLNVVTGNAGTGKTYFDAHCASCHSASGDLAHVGSKYNPADLQQTFLYPDARSGDGGGQDAPKVTVKLASGEVLQGKLKRLDDFNVTLIDAGGNFRTLALGANTKVEVEDKLLEHRHLLDQYTDADMHNLTAYLVTLK
jgi:cytochrome c oxidase cbb3-type subunit III